MNWFKRKALFFIPVRWPGWLIAAAAVVYTVYIAIDINAHQDSVSDFLMNLVFNLLIIGSLYALIGYLTSKN